MSVRLEDQTIVLDGNCGVEDVDALMSHLDNNPGLPVDLTSSGTIHTALWQLLLMRGTEIRGSSHIPFVRDHLLPALRAAKPGRSGIGMDEGPIQTA